MINKAIQFATMAHSNQVRKNSNTPFVIHCLEVGTLATSITIKMGGFNEETVAAAFLHDTIEDSYVSYETLKEVFNERVAELVATQSENKTKSWQERKEHTMEVLDNNKDLQVEICYLSDKLANLRSLSSDLKMQGESVWDRFNAPKEKQEWYYKTIGQKLKLVTDTSEFCEYTNLLSEIFKAD